MPLQKLDAQRSLVSKAILNPSAHSPLLLIGEYKQRQKDTKKNDCITIAKKGNKGKMLREQTLTMRTKGAIEKRIQNIPFYR